MLCDPVGATAPTKGLSAHPLSGRALPSAQLAGNTGKGGLFRTGEDWPLPPPQAPPTFPVRGRNYVLYSQTGTPTHKLKNYGQPVSVVLTKSVVLCYASAFFLPSSYSFSERKLFWGSDPGLCYKEVELPVPPAENAEEGAPPPRPALKCSQVLPGPSSSPFRWSPLFPSHNRIIHCVPADAPFLPAFS